MKPQIEIDWTSRTVRYADGKKETYYHACNERFALRFLAPNEWRLEDHLRNEKYEATYRECKLKAAELMMNDLVDNAAV